MNDRMTELYAKACLDARDIHPTDVPAFIACMAENFAELIVRECAKVCRDQPNIYAHKADRDNCAIAIEEHFGVEE